MAKRLKLAKTTAQRITISTKSHSFDLLPMGDEVQVSEEAFALRYTQALINSGYILYLGDVAEEPITDIVEQVQEAAEDIESLRKQADELGIQYDGRWGAKKLQAAIEEALQ